MKKQFWIGKTGQHYWISTFQYDSRPPGFVKGPFNTLREAKNVAKKWISSEIASLNKQIADLKHFKGQHFY